MTGKILPSSAVPSVRYSPYQTVNNTGSSYTSYNLDESDADHMAYLESRWENWENIEIWMSGPGVQRDIKILFIF